MKRTGAFLMIVAFLIYCSASVFAASPAEILLEDFDRFADEKAAVEDFLQKTAEESASPDNVKTFSMEGAYRCLSAPVMDRELLLATARGDDLPEDVHVLWSIPCTLQNGLSGNVLVEITGDEMDQSSLFFSEDLRFPSREDLAEEISVLAGGDVDSIVCVVGYDYGATGVFCGMAEGELYVIPYVLGWDSPEMQTMDYFTKGDAVSALGHKAADTDLLLDFLEELRSASIGTDQNGALVSGRPGVEMIDGKPTVIPMTLPEDLPTDTPEEADDLIVKNDHPSGTTAESMLFVGGLLVIFAVLAYGDPIFKKNR